MNLDEAIKHCEEVAEAQMARADALDEIPLFGMDENDGKQIEACYKCAEEHRQLAEWLRDYKRLLEQTQWTPISEYGYPNPEDEYKHFLTVDNKGEITIQEFYLSLDEERRPYFSGMVNVIAWMPLPEPYREVEK